MYVVVTSDTMVSSLWNNPLNIDIITVLDEEQTLEHLPVGIAEMRAKENIAHTTTTLEYSDIHSYLEKIMCFLFERIIESCYTHCYYEHKNIKTVFLKKNHREKNVTYLCIEFK